MRIFRFNFLRNAYEVYQKHFVHVLILETFSVKGPLTNSEIVDYLLLRSRVPWEITSGITLSYINIQITYLASIELIKLSSENKITISNKGIESLRTGTFHTLSSSAFFGLLGAAFAVITIIISLAALLISLKCK